MFAVLGFDDEVEEDEQLVETVHIGYFLVEKIGVFPGSNSLKVLSYYRSTYFERDTIFFANLTTKSMNPMRNFIAY